MSTIAESIKKAFDRSLHRGSGKIRLFAVVAWLVFLSVGPSSVFPQTGGGLSISELLSTTTLKIHGTTATHRGSTLMVPMSAALIYSTDEVAYGVTNRHFVEGMQFVRTLACIPGLPYEPMEVVAIDSKADLALIKFAPGVTVPFPPLAESDPVPGERCYAAGYPNDVNRRRERSGYVSAIGSDVTFTFTCDHGDSGGPVVNERGELVAVLYAKIADGSNTALGVPVSKIRSLVSRYTGQGCYGGSCPPRFTPRYQPAPRPVPPPRPQPKLKAPFLPKLSGCDCKCKGSCSDRFAKLEAKIASLETRELEISAEQRKQIISDVLLAVPRDTRLSDSEVATITLQVMRDQKVLAELRKNLGPVKLNLQGANATDDELQQAYLGETLEIPPVQLEFQQGGKPVAFVYDRLGKVIAVDINPIMESRDARAR